MPHLRFSYLANRSIARDLILWLSGIVLVIILLLGVSYKFYFNRQFQRELALRSNQILEDVANALYFPLLHLDDQSIRNIASFYLDTNDYVTGIEVVTDFGDVVVDQVPASFDDLLIRTKTLYRNEKNIGSVTIYVSGETLLGRVKNVIRSVFLASILIIAVMAICTRLILHYLLNRPLEALIARIRRIASGDYTTPLQPVPHQDLNAIIEAVNSMAREIESKNRQLAESEKKYRSIFNNATEGIFQSTVSGRLVTANPAVAQIFGYRSVAELIDQVTDLGKQFYVNPDDRQRLIEQLETEGMVSKFITPMRKSDGTTVWISLTARAIRDEDGNLTMLEGTLSDITHHRQIEAELRHAQKMEAIGTLAGGIAHDFNNILVAIFGFTELAQMHAEDNPQLMQHLTEVMNAAGRARDLVQQILTFSRKNEASEHAVFQPAKELREALSLLRSTIPTTVDIRETILTSSCIKADPTRFHQIVMNLGTNGFHAMEDGCGILEFTLIDEELLPGQTVSNDLEPGKYVVLEVRDDGVGMDEATMAKIFEPYFTTKDMDKGTGLGLAIVHGTVKSWKGTIQVDSTVGEGTTFRIYLPMVPDPVEKEAGGKETEPTGQSRTARIMLVDDEETICKLMSMYLSELGHEVLSFTDPGKAMALLREDPEAWNMLILDVTMPDMPGDRFAAQALKLRPDLPIILCTGYSNRVDARMAKKLGVAAFIRKPVRMSILARTVGDILQNGRDD
ncbi:ATP-binding protein [Desulfolithobacter sp.]